MSLVRLMLFAVGISPPQVVFQFYAFIAFDVFPQEFALSYLNVSEYNIS